MNIKASEGKLFILVTNMGDSLNNKLKLTLKFL